MTCERFGMMYYFVNEILLSLNGFAGRNYGRFARGNMSIRTARGACLECIYGFECARPEQIFCTPV